MYAIVIEMAWLITADDWTLLSHNKLSVMYLTRDRRYETQICVSKNDAVTDDCESQICGVSNSNFDFRVMIFNVRCLDNGTRWSYAYNGRLIEVIYRVVPFSVTLND